MVGAEAAEAGKGSPRPVHEPKLHPLGELQPWGNLRSAESAHCLDEGKGYSQPARRSLLDRRGIGTRNICVALQVFFLLRL